MRMREKGFDDYYIGQTELDRVRIYAQLNTPESRKVVWECAEEVNSEIAGELYYSLIKWMSYDRLCRAKEIPITKPSFLGYRRKCIALISQKIKNEHI